MKRATMTFPDDLAEAVDNYRQAQEAPPSLTTVVQTALREYLRTHPHVAKIEEPSHQEGGAGATVVDLRQ